MYYKTVGDKIVSFSSIEEIHPESETVGYLSIDEFSRYYDRLGFYSWCAVSYTHLVSCFIFGNPQDSGMSSHPLHTSIHAW